MVPRVLDPPCGTVVKSLPASVGNAGGMGSIPRLGRSPGEGNGNLLQYSFLKNPMDREAWQSRGCKESDMTERAQIMNPTTVLELLCQTSF